ncbi:unnamed protein product [Dibothriocephalus latus]|uniref:Tetraspanin n=1 Tax=Dibothriocephalus latus TaxID=60516 RepID=A0A3P6TLE3_DIBLA|nr:unnamed protein product [Dibothriocephalus latus]
MPDSPDPEKWKLTDSVYAKKSTSNVNKYWRVGLILLHICLMLEAAFILALGTNLKFGPTSGIVRMFIAMFLPNAPTVTVELIIGVLVVSNPEIIAIGVVLMIVFAIGVIVSCFGNKKALKIYAFLLGILILGLIIATAITFGKQNYLSDKALLYMSENLETYKNNYHDKNQLAVATWSTVMREGSHYCCGLAGYKDFKGCTRMPAPCCSVDNQEAVESCKYTTAAAMKPLVPGCVEKIIFYVNLSEPSLAVAPVSFIVPPLIVLIVVICAALC